MLRTTLALALAALLIPMASPLPAGANSPSQKQARFAEKVKAGIARLGAGRDTRVKVKLQDKTKLEGYISEIKETSFVVTSLQTGAATKVAYPDVTQVKGHNLTTNQKIALWVGIGVGVFLLCLVIAVASCDGCT